MTTTSPVIRNTMIRLADLAPHPSNYRTHPESQIQDLMASLLRFGQVRSIVAQEGPRPLCVAGHGIVEAARRLEYSELRADLIPAEWTPAEVKGYLIADNQHAANAIDDEAILASLIQEQKDLGLDLATLGTDEKTLRQLIASAGDRYLAGDDASAGGDDGEHEAGSLLALLNVTIADPLHEVHTGEVWTLGKHFLICSHVFKDWAIWTKYLTSDDCLFLPFAGPLVPLSKKADSYTLVMVQPDTYIAGHVLDRYAEIHGERSVKMVKQFTIIGQEEIEEDE